jgi:hypothetical protein
VLETGPNRTNRRPVRVKTPKSNLPLYALFLVAAGLLVAGGMAVYRARPVGGTQTEELVQIGQKLVREAVREDLQTHFSSTEETVVESLSENRFRVSGWVDLMTEDGQVDRDNFTLEIYKNESDDWVGEKIAVLPQI